MRSQSCGLGVCLACELSPQNCSLNLAPERDCQSKESCLPNTQRRMSSFRNFQHFLLFSLLVGGYGMLLTLSFVFRHYNLFHNPVSSLSLQLSLLILQPILLGLFARLGCRHPYELLAEVIFICNAYILSRSERLRPDSIIGLHGLKFQPI